MSFELVFCIIRSILMRTIDIFFLENYLIYLHFCGYYGVLLIRSGIDMKLLSIAG